MFMDPLLGEFASFIETKPTTKQIREYAKLGNHTKLVEVCIEQILLYMNDQEEWDNEHIESLPEYRAIVHYYEQSRLDNTAKEEDALLWLYV